MTDIAGGTLTDRYVAAVLRAIPMAQRTDIDRELRASIADDAEARIAAGAAPDTAEYEAIAALGAPWRLAASYTGRSPSLIGPEIYPVWLHVLRIVLATAVPATFAVLTIVRIAQGTPIGEAVLAGLATAFQVLLWVTVGLTVAFALIERVGDARREVVKGLSTWRPEMLPAVQPTTRAIPRSESIGEIIGGAIGIAILAVIAAVGQVRFIGEDHGVLLRPEFIAWVPYFIVVQALTIVLAGIKVYVGRWSWWIALATTLISAASGFVFAWLFLTGQVVGSIVTDIPEVGAFFDAYGLVSWLGAAGIAFGTVWGIVAAWRKALARR